MHKKMSLAAILFLVACGLVTSVSANAEVKVGYVNFAKVLDEAPQAESALRKLKAEFDPRDKKIVEMQNRVKDLEQDLEKNALVMKEQERINKEREAGMLKRDLRRVTQEFREDYNLRRNEELAALEKIVEKAIVEIARQEGYDLILQVGVIYAGPKVDITDKILKRLGKK